MTKRCLTIVLTLICVLGFGLRALAQEEDTVVATVPFEFVVGGQVLPPGMYRVSRTNSDGSRELKISSYETGAGALLIPTFFDDTQIGHGQLNFEHAGDKYFLSGIETPIGTYAISVPRSAIRLALMEQQGTLSSGSN